MNKKIIIFTEEELKEMNLKKKNIYYMISKINDRKCKKQLNKSSIYK